MQNAASRNHKAIVIIAIFIFVLMVVAGLFFATKRPVVADEFHSLGTMHKVSYLDILLGQLPEEANNFPLFYLMHKPLCVNLDYALKKSDMDLDTLRHRSLLRVNSVLFTAFFVVMMFYYFATNYSITAGFLSVVVSITSYATTLYWIEGRPYALWIFLAALQSLVFLELIKKGYEPSRWRNFIMANVLLCLTSVLSAIAVIVFSVFCWFFVVKDWKKYVLATMVPVLLAYSYAHALPNNYSLFSFNDSAFSIIRANFSLEKLVIILFAGVVFLRNSFKKDKTAKEAYRTMLSLCLLMVGAFLVTLIIMAVFQYRSDINGLAHVSRRYFVYLNPVGIIVMTLSVFYLFEHFKKNKKFYYAIMIIVSMLLIGRAFSTVDHMRGIFEIWL